jgi:inner membrane protein involved in colicin E2 resistance
MAFGIGGSGSVTLKAVMIGVIVVLLVIPLAMLRGLVSERAALREQAYTRVAEGWGGNVVLGGPMLVVPVQQTMIENVNGKDVARLVRNDVYLLPARLDISVDLKMQDEPRYVGIYAVPVYLADVRLAGEFDFKALRERAANAGPEIKYLWQQSRLLLPLSSVRSLREVTQATFAGRTLELGPGAPAVYRGIETAVDLTAALEGSSSAFEFHTKVAGSRDLSMLPLGSTTSLQLHSNWPHPSFHGAFLPAEHTITADGFDARWQVLELNRSFRQVWSEFEVNEAADISHVLCVGAGHAQSAASAAIPAHRSRVEHFLSAADRAVRAHRVRCGVRRRGGRARSAHRSLSGGCVAQFGARRRCGSSDERRVRAAICAGVVRGLRTPARRDSVVRSARRSDAGHASHRLVSNREHI